MSEAGAEVRLTCQFLQAVGRSLAGSGSPQMRLQTRTSLARLESRNTEPLALPPNCRHCYSPVNLQRDNIRLQNVSKSLTMNIRCHVCRRDSSQQEICFPKFESLQETKTRSEEDQNLQKVKKKKSKKDKNAGLNLPPASPHSRAPMKTKTDDSKNKLKHLLAADKSSNKSCLQDFLKKL